MTFLLARYDGDFPNPSKFAYDLEDPTLHNQYDLGHQEARGDARVGTGSYYGNAPDPRASDGAGAGVAGPQHTIHRREAAKPTQHVYDLGTAKPARLYDLEDPTDPRTAAGVNESNVVGASDAYDLGAPTEPGANDYLGAKPRGKTTYDYDSMSEEEI